MAVKRTASTPVQNQPIPLASVKAYLRVDGDEDDALIGTLLTAAVEYLSQAGVTPPGTGPRLALYTLAVNAMCLSWYEKRDPVITGTIVAENPMLRQVITQLKLTEPPGEMGEEG